MATKRQPSKQQRQAQNRANRAALERRRQNVKTVQGAASAAPAEPAPKKSSSVLGRLTGSGRTSAPAGGSATSGQPRTGSNAIGYRAGLTAVFLAFIGIVFAVTLKAPVDHDGEIFANRDDKTADWAWSALHTATQNPESAASDLVSKIDWQPGGSKPYVKAAFPMSLAVALPLLASGLAFWSIRRGATSRVVNRCMYVCLFGALLTQQLALMFLPAAIAIGVAGYQLRKQEMADAAANPSPADDVIDVDEVAVDDDAELDVEVEDDDVIDAEVVHDADDEPAEDEAPVVAEQPAAPQKRAGGGLQLTNRPDADA